MRITESKLRTIIRKMVSESTSSSQVDDTIQMYKSDPRRWAMFASGDFYDMAQGGDAGGVRDEYYPGWADEDFISVIEGVDGSYEP